MRILLFVKRPAGIFWNSFVENLVENVKNPWKQPLFTFSPPREKSESSPKI